MSLILATGSNIGDRKFHLRQAKDLLCHHFKLIKESRLYSSEPVDYFDQPHFLNQVLEFQLPHMQPLEAFHLLQSIERQMKRVKEIDKGPRNIDIDLLFWGKEILTFPNLTVPHPRWSERSFVVLPLRELPYFETIQKWFKIPESFEFKSFPLD